jgi:ectoine hydroxylase-related dioxygenase (phytanoyl-CoA dioxygenase family)
MKPRIFREEGAQAQFDREGYVVIDFISSSQAQAIADKFYQLHTDIPKGFYSAGFNPDAGFKGDIYSHIDGLIVENLECNFQDFKKLGSTFLCKAPGAEGIMDPHQDWTVVDEDKFYSATIWIPTIDTTEQNGALKVLPGSHLLFDYYRSNHVEVCYRGSEKLLWDHMVTIPVRAGQAIVLNHAVIHASGPNNTDRERLAVAYGLIPSSASLLYYHKNEKGRIEKYDMPDTFFQDYYNIGERPLFGTLVGEFDYHVPHISTNKIAQLIHAQKRNREMKPLFKNKETQANFDRDGYVKVPVLEAAAVKELLDFYESVKFKDEVGMGFHISMDQVDKGLVKRILDKLFEVALPRLEPIFDGAKPFVGSFVIKEPNPTSIVPVHQDWSFVEDEERHCSVTCWVALVDTNMDNGAMGVIKGSHNYFKNLRPSPSPQVPSPISEHMFTIFPYLHLIEMKAGEALIFDNRTFHGSPPNTTAHTRVAFGIGFTHSDAKLVHYYLKPDGKKDTVLKYDIDESFFLKYENARLAKMYDRQELIEGYHMEAEMPYILPKFTGDELRELIKSTGNEMNMPMCEMLAKRFNYDMSGSPIAGQQADSHSANGNKQAEEKPWVWVDDRGFFEKYTPLNIAREVKKKLFGAYS